MAGEWREIEIDLRGLSSIDQLQDEVADGCAAFDEEDLDEDLVMQFEEEATGEWHVVTNSVPFGRVRSARQLRLAPRDRLPEANHRRSNHRRSRGSARGRGSPSRGGRGSDDDDDLAGGRSRVALLKGPQDDDAASTLD